MLLHPSLSFAKKIFPDSNYTAYLLWTQNVQSRDFQTSQYEGTGTYLSKGQHEFPISTMRVPGIDLNHPSPQLASTQKTIAIVTKRKINNQKKFHRHLRSNFNLVVIDSDDLSEEIIQDYDVIILSDLEDDDISSDEIDALREFSNGGRSIAIFGSSSSSSHTGNPQYARLNDFLLEYGMKFNNDGVVRTTYSNYLHPKHALIADGILHSNVDPNNDTAENSAQGPDMDSVEFVYPFGCTLEVQSPSWPILSSGSFCFPLRRPVCGVWEDSSNSNKSSTRMQKRGRLLACGSVSMLTDDWFHEKANGQILEKFVDFLTHHEATSFARSKSKKEHIEEARTVPDIEALSERLKWCLHENNPLPQDLTTLFCRDMLCFDTSMIPKVLDLYGDINVKHEPLTLILPEFERPIPPLQPALFQPKLMDLPFPSLDQFDLDEEFAEPANRLAQLTNKCINTQCVGEDDLEYYVQEAGSITNLISQDEELDAKAVLSRLFQKVSKQHVDKVQFVV